LPTGAGRNDGVLVHGRFHVRLDPGNNSGSDPGEGTRDSTAERRTNGLGASHRKIG